MYSGSESPSHEKGKKSDGRRIGTYRQIEKEEVMERLADDTIESFMNAIEERLAEGQKNKIPFSRFLEEKMDAFDYSNTSLAKKVFHRVEKKKEGTDGRNL